MSLIVGGSRTLANEKEGRGEGRNEESKGLMDVGPQLRG